MYVTATLALRNVSPNLGSELNWFNENCSWARPGADPHREIISDLSSKRKSHQSWLALSHYYRFEVLHRPVLRENNTYFNNHTTHLQSWNWLWQVCVQEHKCFVVQEKMPSNRTEEEVCAPRAGCWVFSKTSRSKLKAILSFYHLVFVLFFSTQLLTW